MSVQLINQAGTWLLTGPAVPLVSRGRITALGSTQHTVSVGDQDYLLGMISGLSVQVGDPVTIDWANRVIIGKPTTDAPSVGTPGIKPPSITRFDVTVQAVTSATYLESENRWSDGELLAAPGRSGAWFYGSALANTLVGASVETISIYLPAIRLENTLVLGVHTHAQAPTGAPVLTAQIPLDSARDWVVLPSSLVSALQAESARGVGITSTTGDNQFAGVPGDPLSGAIRITGTR
ncbi:hypothetical protein D9V34_07095 [Mycetocola lacteus]|uniref:Uncharacterized protein n=1 Tax=Mycetocola lacteus TaxID=76637 RepID=A0A3L7AUJ9_9MICO|nr:hypothetical protein [Mycetocola lacteus]RLP83002.1 hypothetical protein D9V34_07095 [Mycetocola lacteus]